jgi:hypothetical protein
MKTFIIVRKYDLEIMGSYEAEVADSTSNDRSSTLAEPNCAHIELAEGLEADCVSASLSGEEIVLSADSAKSALKVLKGKEAQVAAAYNSMNADVLAQMLTVFGTSKPESATAFKETWDMMAASPADWATAGLTASFAVAGFQVGDALDSSQKIQDYANAKIAEVKAYGISRMQRIEQFKTEKATILA